MPATKEMQEWAIMQAYLQGVEHCQILVDDVTGTGRTDSENEQGLGFKAGYAPLQQDMQLHAPLIGDEIAGEDLNARFGAMYRNQILASPSQVMSGFTAEERTPFRQGGRGPSTGGGTVPEMVQQDGGVGHPAEGTATRSDLTR